MGSFKRLWREWILPLGIEILVLVFLLKVVFMLVLVPSGSMLPTIEEKSVLFCTYVHDVGKLQRGEIVVFQSDELNKVLIKRLIGLPGETVVVHPDGTVSVNGETIQEKYVEYSLMNENVTFQVPDGHYLFLGDNRAGSADAREWKDPYIAADKIKARARFTLWPFSHFGVLK